MGRKKIVSELGIKHPYCFWLYPSEKIKLDIEFKKLKKQRVKYQHNV